MGLPIMKEYSLHQVIEAIDQSYITTGLKRFERRCYNGSVHVRAVFGRRIERSPYHEESKVPRLVYQCMTSICDKLEMFDFEEFPDEFLLIELMQMMRQQKRLNNKAFNVLLGAQIQHLDLGGIYITINTLKLIGERCPYLKVLNLRESGYIMSDNVFETLIKKLPDLETLNLSGCHHLTDQSLNAISQYIPRLRHLNINRIPQLTEQAILNLVTACQNLIHLDIYDNPNISISGRETLEEVVDQRNVTILLRGLKYESNIQKNVSLTLQLANCSQFW